MASWVSQGWSSKFLLNWPRVFFFLKGKISVWCFHLWKFQNHYFEGCLILGGVFDKALFFLKRSCFMKFSLLSLLSSFLVWFFLGFSSLLVALSLLDSFVTSLPLVFCWASQFHCWVFPVIAGLVTSNSVCMTLTSIHCQELMKSLWCCGRWSLHCMLLLQVTEHVHDCCGCSVSDCRNILNVLWLNLLFFLFTDLLSL